MGQRKLNEFGPGIGFSSHKEEKAKLEADILLRKELEKTFAPEFLNRLDEIIYFDQLTKEGILSILEVELQKMKPRLESLGFKLKLTDNLKNKIAEVGYDPKYGARPLKRVLQKYIEDTIAENMLGSKINKGDTVTLDLDPKKEGGNSVPVKVKIQSKKQNPPKEEK